MFPSVPQESESREGRRLLDQLTFRGPVCSLQAPREDRLDLFSDVLSIGSSVVLSVSLPLSRQPAPRRQGLCQCPVPRGHSASTCRVNVGEWMPSCRRPVWRQPLPGDTEFSALVTGELSQPQGYSVKGSGGTLCFAGRLSQDSGGVLRHPPCAPLPPSPPPFSTAGAGPDSGSALCSFYLAGDSPPGSLFISLASKCWVPSPHFSRETCSKAGPVTWQELGWGVRRRLLGAWLSASQGQQWEQTPFRDLWVCSWKKPSYLAYEYEFYIWKMTLKC